jgi:hypothetical protein
LEEANMRELILVYLEEQRALQKRILEPVDKHDTYARGYQDGALETLQQLKLWAEQLDEVAA